MIPLLTAYVKKHHLMEEKQVDAWAADLHALGNRGEYFFSLTRYLFSARKPKVRTSQNRLPRRR